MVPVAPVPSGNVGAESSQPSVLVKPLTSMATLPRDITYGFDPKLSPNFSWLWGELLPQHPLTPLPLYLPECVYNYRECQGRQSTVASESASGHCGLEVSTLFTLISLRAFWEISLLHY